MTLATLTLLGVTAGLVLFKLALFALIVALAAKTLIPGYKLPKVDSVMAYLPTNKRCLKR